MDSNDDLCNSYYVVSQIVLTIGELGLISCQHQLKTQGSQLLTTLT